MTVPVAVRESEELTVFAEICKVASPCVNTDGVELNAFIRSLLEAGKYFII